MSMVEEVHTHTYHLPASSLSLCTHFAHTLFGSSNGRSLNVCAGSAYPIRDDGGDKRRTFATQFVTARGADDNEQ